MSTDDLLNTLPPIDWRWAYVVLAAGIALTLLALLARRIGRHNLAGRVTAVAAALGLGWSAQGMWDTAVHHYHQDVIVASVLFAVFEAMLIAKMLRAHQYRTDLVRRAKPVRAVWTIATVMGLVVALGEGWAQAPARLAIPLLVAYGWYTDLTADDDPATALATSWRWTPRRLGLALGLLEPGARDARTIDRDRLRDRLTRMAFRIHHAPAWLNDALRRPIRLAKLKTLADDADLSVVRTRLARMSVDLMQPETTAVSSLIVSPRRRLELPDPDRRVMGVHVREGKVLRGKELRADAVAVMRASILTSPPRGMTTAELAAHYDPPLGQRTADGFAAEARKLNGRPVG